MTNPDISFKLEHGKFFYRVAGVITHQNRILLVAEEGLDFWYLPGGRANLFETSEQALRREIQEELGTTPIVERLLWTTEAIYLFKAKNVKHHELAFYYSVRLPDDSPFFNEESWMGEELYSEEKCSLCFRWFDIDQLDEVALVPKFLQKGIKEIPSSPQHLIIDEL